MRAMMPQNTRKPSPAQTRTGKSSQEGRLRRGGCFRTTRWIQNLLDMPVDAFIAKGDVTMSPIAW